jgi:hypothetical protein
VRAQRQVSGIGNVAAAGFLTEQVAADGQGGARAQRSGASALASRRQPLLTASARADAASAAPVEGLVEFPQRLGEPGHLSGCDGAQ